MTNSSVIQLEEENLPLIYIKEQDIDNFIISDELFQQGIVYEWEKEQVFHVRLIPEIHSFGIEHSLLFVKDSVQLADIQQRTEYIVHVGDSIDRTNFYHITTEGPRKYSPCFIPSQQNLYDSDKGILEVGILAHKRVLIIGLGSFGSQITIELAKAGIGHFALIDFDRVEPHNLSRHTCTLNELGRLKTDAIYDAIKGKNPYATIEKFPIDINKNLELLDEEVKKADIVICATDNNRSRFHITESLVKNKTVGIYGRAVTRAEGGDVFRYRPGGPCYCCLIGNKAYQKLGPEEITNEQSARMEGRIAPYTLPEDADAMVQVGLSTDIQPMCNMMVKLTLIELSRGLNSGISPLEEELVWDCYLWANRRERYRKNWSRMPKNPSIMRWYGLKFDRNPNCSICSDNDFVLDTGD